MGIIENIEGLKKMNYVRKAQPKNDYWVDFSKGKLDGYINKYGSEFNIVIYSGLSDDNYYVIPYAIIKHLFQDEYLSKDKNNIYRKRWVATVRNHLFKVTNNSVTIDIKEYYLNPFQKEKYESDKKNDYAIENMKKEINVRIKQSKFRKGVFENFNRQCCISGVTEDDLLVASHIIPWADRIITRLDPTNGLCLSVLYDKLFDKGYFTLTDDLKVVVTKEISKLSLPLSDILKTIDGVQIQSPQKMIKQEYLAYHRKHIFIDRKEK